MSGPEATRSNKDDFGRAIAKIAVAQIGESIGFHSFQNSAVETLADIAIRYIVDISKTAQFYSNVARRTECNVFDVILALEDIIPGGVRLDLSQPLSKSSALKDIMKFVDYAEEVPFARPLPHFPVPKKRTLVPSFAQLGEEPPGPHIPAWLPAFPDLHTYRSTPVWSEKKSDPTADKLEQARQRRRAERSLLSLHQRLSSTSDRDIGSRALFPASSSFDVTQTAVPREQEMLLSKLHDADGKGKAKRATSSQNPFLAAPLPPGAKEVSPISFSRSKDATIYRKDSLQPQRSLTLLEAFAPVLNGINDASKEAMLSKDSRKSSILDAKHRPPVLLTFDFGRKAQSKAMAAQLSLGLPTQNAKKGKGKLNLQEEDKDEKKKRAEQILAQADDGVDVGNL